MTTQKVVAKIIVVLWAALLLWVVYHVSFWVFSLDSQPMISPRVAARCVLIFLGADYVLIITGVRKNGLWLWKKETKQ